MAGELLLQYRHPSTASADGVGLVTCGGEERTYFDGFAEHPAVTAHALLAVARVARTRFFTPAAMVAAAIRAADPVVTAEPGRLRFESFSVCCGVHARFDLREDGLDVRECVPGTTNVDFNPPMREALGGLGGGEPLRITVGADSVAVQTLAGPVVERRVPLPDRWVKGFGEVQVATAHAVPLFELDGMAARRFLRALPRGAGGEANYWADGVRLARTPQRGGAFVAAPARLRVLEPLARHATRLIAYGTPDATVAGTVAWMLELPGARLTLTLSPDRSRGFSGEGGFLFDLLAEDEVTRRGYFGELGYDVGDGAHFERRLPYPREVLRREPARLRDARRLAGAVTFAADGSALVTSEGCDYRVSGEGRERRCTCQWMATHGTSRGPCKHVLATLLA
jgi:hypothetical protein